MELQFKDLDSSALKTLAPLFTFRENKTCDSVFLGLFLWKDYYQVRTRSEMIIQSSFVLTRMERSTQPFPSVKRPACPSPSAY